MKQPFFRILFIAFLAFSISCDLKKEQLQVVKLSPTLSIDILSDSTFFSSSTACLSLYDNLLYFSDAQRSQIIALDKDLKLVKTIGRNGNGPSDLFSATYFYISKDTLVVADIGNNRFQFYDVNGNHVKTIFDADKLSLAKGGGRFIYENNALISSSNLECAVMKLNLDTRNAEQWGEKFLFPSKIQTEIRNSRNIVQSDSTIIAVSDNMSCIERFNNKGELLEKYDISRIPVVEDLIELHKSLPPSEENSYRVLTYDTQMHGEKLMVLLTKIDIAKKQSQSSIIVFDISSKITPDCVYEMPPNNIYYSIAFDENYIYAFNSTANTIERFKI